MKKFLQTISLIMILFLAGCNNTNKDVSTAAISEVFEIGDYVEYEPNNSNNYTLYASETGLAGSYESVASGYNNNGEKELIPEKVIWRVWDANDDSIIIIPSRAVNPLRLMGEEGYLNGIDVMNKVCKSLYTSSELGVEDKDITVMTIEDIENVTAYDKNSYENYGKTESYISGNYFYTYEEDGITKTSKDAKVAKGDDGSVLVKQTEYRCEVTPPNWSNILTIGWKNITNNKLGALTYGDIIGKDSGWLASQCASVSELQAYFKMFNVSSDYIEGVALYDSFGREYTNQNKIGLRPLIKLDKNLLVDLSNDKMDGTSENNAWKLKR